jgi:hypothetical protein
MVRQAQAASAALVPVALVISSVMFLAIFSVVQAEVVANKAVLVVVQIYATPLSLI